MDRLYIVGGAILAALALAVGAYFYGRSDGTAIEAGKWQAREAVTLAATNKTLSEMYARYRDKEQAWATELQQVAGSYEKEKEDAKHKTDGLVASVGKPGGVRLRDLGATCGETGGSPVPDAAPTPGRSDAAAGCQLSTEASRFLLALTGEADDAVRRLKACQAALFTDRR